MNRNHNTTGRAWGLIAVLVLALVPGAARAATLKVVTTVTDLAWVVQSIGGDRVQVTALCKGYQDPHYLQAKPSYAKDLKKADLLLFTGLELEVAWLPRLLDTARNPKLRPGSPDLVDASAAVDGILEIPTGPTDRSQGDIHPLGNPHYVLDPRKLIPIGEAVSRALADADPDGAEAYAAGYDRFQTDLTAKIAAWETRAEPLRGKPIVAFHKQWEYLADWLGLDILDYIENRPGVPPSPRHVSELIDAMKAKKAQLVICAPFVDVHAAQEVARRGGARQVVLPSSVGGVDGTDTYPQLIDTILGRLLGDGS